jgi:ubiquinone/menaquinone biosynthesis C-methylase UbiE
MHRLRFIWLALLIFVDTTVLAAAESPSLGSRSNALIALCQRLQVGPGSVIADVGCGDGLDTLVFASIVGRSGTVLAQEIDVSKLKKVVERADQGGFAQIVPVLGQSDDPRLPDGSVDMIYLCRVFHHFSRPQAMLQRLWDDLAPGGYLVVVDQQKGPLTDWAPMDRREHEHHWTGETTVVRLAREAGFLFHDALDELWHEKPPFVLVFRKPAKPAKTKGDPDLARPLDARRLVRALPLAETGDAGVVFVGLDRGRSVVPVLRSELPTSSRVFDVVLEEWALSREERPSEAPRPGVEIFRTEKGILTLPAEVSPGLVLFVDAYHRLWDPVPFLRQLRAQVPRSGRVAVVDRQGPHGETRRLAGHRRHISSQLVIEEMRQAGFSVQRRLPAPAKDRFYLLFGPSRTP